MKKSLINSQNQFFAAVRRLVNPYILRRLKNDKRIINDLPDKTEMPTYCTLTKQQIGFYQQAVNELAAKLEAQTDDIIILVCRCSEQHSHLASVSLPFPLKFFSMVF